MQLPNKEVSKLGNRLGKLPCKAITHSAKSHAENNLNRQNMRKNKYIGHNIRATRQTKNTKHKTTMRATNMHTNKTQEHAKRAKLREDEIDDVVHEMITRM